MKNPYELLEISVNATDDEIKSKYHKLAMSVHPDLNPDDPLADEKFKAISWAYSKLINHLERNKIDKKLGINRPANIDPFIQDAEYSDLNRRKDFKVFDDGEYFDKTYNKILRKKRLEYLVLVFVILWALFLVGFTVYSISKLKKHSAYVADLKLTPVASYKTKAPIKDKTKNKIKKMPNVLKDNATILSDKSDLYYTLEKDVVDETDRFKGCKIANPKKINKYNRKYLKYNAEEKLWYICIKETKPSSQNKPTK